MNEEKINNAFEELELAKKELFSAGERAIEKKAALEWRKVDAMQNGEIEGKNAEAREAAAKSLLAPEYEALELAEKDERKARFDYDVAHIEVERVRSILRLLEVTGLK